jgi:uncharacterized protein
MNPALKTTTDDAADARSAAIAAAIESACRSIAPTWPLDRFIAVSPYWSKVDQPFDAVDAGQRRLAGCGLLMPLDYYRQAWRERRFTREQLIAALDEQGAGIAPDPLIADLETGVVSAASTPPLPLLCDSVDARRDLSHAPAWAELVTQQVSQFCAAWFDSAEADWSAPAGSSLYADWRRAIIAERGIDLLVRAPHRKAQLAALAGDAPSMIAQAVDALDIPASDLDALLRLVLLRINGWAASCAYRRWQAGLAGGEDDTIVELLAIRLAWETLLDDGKRDERSTWAEWRRAWQQRQAEHDLDRRLRVFQRALEMAYQEPLAWALANAAPAGETEPTEVLAVFCIDVRSEVFRRALESVSANLRTAGFAGFFGLPVAYTPIATRLSEPRLPGLLAPSLEVTEHSRSGLDDAGLQHRRHQRLAAANAWRARWRLPAAAFGLVEALGMGHALTLLRRSLPSAAARQSPTDRGLKPGEVDTLRPRLVIDGVDAEKTRAGLAETVLRAMGLEHVDTRLVALIGHGSQSANNAHAAGLDCGACGGQAGDLNARVLADLLNDTTVREALVRRGLQIPQSTRFVAGLHNTTTDEVRLFDEESISSSHADELQRLHASLRAAGARTRAERAAALGLDAVADDEARLLRALRQRANNWAETRPEWGLAGNAAFIVAPRARSIGIDLGGRAFLHDYDWRRDRGEVLELIMTAPMVVAHWINMQYHASMVDPLLYGSGNKVLHNVVGGHLGVFEGNSGDLRIGLPLQSLHDGKRWMHEPLRLSVFIEAPRAMIDAVIDRHAIVRQLVENAWLHLFRIDSERRLVESYRLGGWTTPAWAVGSDHG